MQSPQTIHLLVVDDQGRQVIPNSIRLIAGRTGQEYNANFVENIKGLMGAAAIGRKIIESDGSSQLREPQISYNQVFDAEKIEIALENTYIWGDNRMNIGC